jgi:hypothetical protein
MSGRCCLGQDDGNGILRAANSGVGTFRHLAARDKRSGVSRLWTTDADLIPLQRAQAPHEAETVLRVRDYGTANALALWFSAQLAPGISLFVGPGDPPTHRG